MFCFCRMSVCNANNLELQRKIQQLEETNKWVICWTCPHAAHLSVVGFYIKRFISRQELKLSDRSIHDLMKQLIKLILPPCKETIHDDGFTCDVFVLWRGDHNEHLDLRQHSCKSTQYRSFHSVCPFFNMNFSRCCWADLRTKRLEAQKIQSKKRSFCLSCRWKEQGVICVWNYTLPLICRLFIDSF